MSVPVRCVSVEEVQGSVVTGCLFNKQACVIQSTGTVSYITVNGSAFSQSVGVCTVLWPGHRAYSQQEM